MKERILIMCLALVWAGAFQTVFGQASAVAPGNTPIQSSGGGGGGGGYVSGGERGSVVQVIGNADVRKELDLNGEQEQAIDAVLQRVREVEGEFFALIHRQHQERIAEFRSRADQRAQTYGQASQQLADATGKILNILTPAQRSRLEALRREAAANPGSFQARIGSRQGGVSGGGFAGGSSSGGATTGGAFGGSGVIENRHEYASGGGPSGVIRVISNAHVQEQLGLSPAQREQIQSVLGEVQQFEGSLKTSLEGARRVPTQGWIEEVKSKEASTRETVTRAGDEILALLNPKQKDRLKQIRLQTQGAEALFKPDVIQSLGLTAAQQIKLTKLRQEAEKQMATLHREGRAFAGDAASIASRRSAIQRDLERRIGATILTPAQQAKWKAMQGQEFAGIAALQNAATGAGGGGGSASTETREVGR